MMYGRRAFSRVPVAGWPKKRELGPLSSGQGKLMQFVDPDRIEQSDRVQAASFAPFCYVIYAMWPFKVLSFYCDIYATWPIKVL